MYANLRQFIVSLPVSIMLSLGFINPAGATLIESDWLDASSGTAEFGDTHPKSFTGFLEFHISSLSNITVTIAALNLPPRYYLDAFEVALFTEEELRRRGHKKDTEELERKVYSDNGMNLSFSLRDLRPGDYFLRISGKPEAIGKERKFPGGTNGGSPTVTAFTLLGPPVTPPVPEPEVWAMMLAGLGLLGDWHSRRSTAAALPA